MSEWRNVNNVALGEVKIYEICEVCQWSQVRDGIEPYA